MSADFDMPCGIPFAPQLLEQILADDSVLPVSGEGQARIIWLSLLGGLSSYENAICERLPSLPLPTTSAVALYTAIIIDGHPLTAFPACQAALDQFRFMSDSETPVPIGTSSGWSVDRVFSALASGTPFEAIIRSVSLMHLTDPVQLLDRWLDQLPTMVATRMPFNSLLEFAVLCHHPSGTPAELKDRLAQAVTQIGDLPDPSPLYRLWLVVCQIFPDWDFACIRAADLAIHLQEYEIATRITRSARFDSNNPWFYDVKARALSGSGEISAALRCWSLALARVDSDSYEFEVFNSRMRSAMRGRLGLAQAWRHARQRQKEPALILLQLLILHDPSYPHYYAVLNSLLSESQGGTCSQASPDPGFDAADFAALLDSIATLRSAGPDQSIAGLDSILSQETLHAISVFVRESKLRPLQTPVSVDRAG